MLIKPFVVPPFNQHYEGEYSERAIEWRRICGIDKVANIRALLGSASIQSVLDVGCGTGTVLAELKKQAVGGSHQGIDVAEPGTHTDPEARGIPLAGYDGKTIPFADNAFDLVYASHVVEHVMNPRAFLSEIARVSRRFVYLEVPCELHFRTKPSDIQSTLNIGHINAFTPQSFCLLCQTSGLTIEDVRLFDHNLKVHQFHTSPLRGIAKMTLRRALLALNPNFASKLLTYHCGILCSGVVH